MDSSGIILSCLLLIQMSIILILLNPMYDVRKITQYLNKAAKTYRSYYFLVIAIYFSSVVYLGMYIPLHDMHRLIFGTFANDYEKLLLLRKIEKNYLIAGFSLFLVVVLYGVRALVSYTASIMELSERQNSTIVDKTEIKEERKSLCSSVNILPNLLRVKRSISYETIIFANEIREQLKNVIRNVEFPYNRSPQLASILEINHSKIK